MSERKAKIKSEGKSKGQRRSFDRDVFYFIYRRPSLGLSSRPSSRENNYNSPKARKIKGRKRKDARKEMKGRKEKEGRKEKK